VAGQSIYSWVDELGTQKYLDGLSPMNHPSFPPLFQVCINSLKFGLTKYTNSQVKNFFDYKSLSKWPHSRYCKIERGQLHYVGSSSKMSPRKTKRKTNRNISSKARYKSKRQGCELKRSMVQDAARGTCILGS